jgi:tRNA-binding EMAP/Myf-like protein
VKKTPVVQIKSIKKHPNADKLEIISFDVDGHEKELVVGVHYADGEYGVFIPVGAIIPDKIAEDMWVLGKLNGKDKNVVGSRIMRGIVSDGMFYGQVGENWKPEWAGQDGLDVASEWGITFSD